MNFIEHQSFHSLDELNNLEEINLISHKKCVKLNEEMKKKEVREKKIYAEIIPKENEKKLKREEEEKVIIKKFEHQKILGKNVFSILKNIPCWTENKFKKEIQICWCFIFLMFLVLYKMDAPSLIYYLYPLHKKKNYRREGKGYCFFLIKNDEDRKKTIDFFNCLNGKVVESRSKSKTVTYKFSEKTLKVVPIVQNLDKFCSQGKMNEFKWLPVFKGFR